MNHTVVCLYFFLLRPPTKPGYRDITMHALYFLWRGRGKTLGRECPTCDEEPVTKKEGKGKGKWTMDPRMKNGRANESLSMKLRPFV